MAVLQTVEHQGNQEVQIENASKQTSFPQEVANGRTSATHAFCQIEIVTTLSEIGGHVAYPHAEQQRQWFVWPERLERHEHGVNPAGLTIRLNRCSRVELAELIRSFGKIELQFWRFNVFVLVLVSIISHHFKVPDTFFRRVHH